MSTWIVTPVYRDVPSFTILRERLLGLLEEDPAAAGGPVRFVVIDDTAGQDPEIDALRGLSDVTILQPPFNLGHQRALVYAVRKMLPGIADTDAVVTLDADGEDRPEDLPRLLAQLSGEREVVLALRTKRREPLPFKLLYRVFQLLFRLLTGTTVRSGNFAAMSGSIAKRALLHPTFDLSYSSAILALGLPVKYVPCERGERYEGRSKMTYGRLAMHRLADAHAFHRPDRVSRPRDRCLLRHPRGNARHIRGLRQHLHLLLDPELDQLHRIRRLDRIARRAGELRQSLHPLFPDARRLAGEHRGLDRGAAAMTGALASSVVTSSSINRRELPKGPRYALPDGAASPIDCKAIQRALG